MSSLTQAGWHTGPLSCSQGAESSTRSSSPAPDARRGTCTCLCRCGRSWSGRKAWGGQKAPTPYSYWSLSSYRENNHTYKIGFLKSNTQVHSFLKHDFFTAVCLGRLESYTLPFPACWASLDRKMRATGWGWAVWLHDAIPEFQVGKGSRTWV